MVSSSYSTESFLARLARVILSLLACCSLSLAGATGIWTENSGLETNSRVAKLYRKVFEGLEASCNMLYDRGVFPGTLTLIQPNHHQSRRGLVPLSTSLLNPTS